MGASRCWLSFQGYFGDDLDPFRNFINRGGGRCAHTLIGHVLIINGLPPPPKLGREENVTSNFNIFKCMGVPHKIIYAMLV